MNHRKSKSPEAEFRRHEISEILTIYSKFLFVFDSWGNKMCDFQGNGTELSPQVFKPAVNFTPFSWLGRDRTLKVCGNQATSYCTIYSERFNEREAQLQIFKQVHSSLVYKKNHFPCQQMMEYIQEETDIHIPKKHTEEPKLTSLSHKFVENCIPCILPEQQEWLCSYIKNTQILSIPETTRSSPNLWLGGHGGTGKKSGRPWPKSLAGLEVKLKPRKSLCMPVRQKKKK